MADWSWTFQPPENSSPEDEDLLPSNLSFTHHRQHANLTRLQLWYTSSRQTFILFQIEPMTQPRAQHRRFSGTWWYSMSYQTHSSWIETRSSHHTSSRNWWRCMQRSCSCNRHDIPIHTCRWRWYTTWQRSTSTATVNKSSVIGLTSYRQRSLLVYPGNVKTFGYKPILNRFRLKTKSLIGNIGGTKF